MSKLDFKLRVEKLKKLIEKYRYFYHVLDKSEISDSALDSLKHELQNLENQYPEFVTPDSPTQRVGGEPLKGFKKVTHQSPMLSLTDVFVTYEVTNWVERVEKVNGRKIEGGYFAELKVDGLAVSLIYENGILVKGVTRGDGKIGEDVTQNIKTIESIPLNLKSQISPPKADPTRSENLKNTIQNSPPEADQPLAEKHQIQNIEVRGEVFMPKKVFEELNKKYKKEGKPLLANPRNGAAGSIRQLDSKLTASRKLSFIAYDVIIY